MAQQLVDRSMSKRKFGWFLFCKTTKVPSTFYLKGLKRVCRNYYKNKRKEVMSGLKKKKKKKAHGGQNMTIKERIHMLKKSCFLTTSFEIEEVGINLK